MGGDRRWVTPPRQAACDAAPAGAAPVALHAGSALLLLLWEVRSDMKPFDSPDTTVDPANLMSLWATPPADDASALVKIRSLYSDPVTINDTLFTPLDLLARIRIMQSAYRDLRHELLERVDAPGRLVVAFRLHGVHAGPLATPLGIVGATDRAFEIRVIDILTLTDGRISKVTMVADELGQLLALGALALT
jgi:hypothetical protein